MTFKKRFQIPGFAFVIGVTTAAGCFAGETNVQRASKTPSSLIKLNFIKEAKLDSVELEQVLSLATKSGMESIAEVNTFHNLPGGGRGISVKSQERVDGRNISYDTVVINKIGWYDGYGAEPAKGSRRAGSFWIDASGKYTTLQRTYELNGAFVRITIGKGVGVIFADKVIPLIASKKTRFKTDFARHDFERLGEFKPDSIRASSTRDGYELWSKVSMEILTFEFENGQVVITGVGHYSI